MFGTEAESPPPLQIAALLNEVSLDGNGSGRAGLKDVCLTLEQGEIAAVLGQEDSGAPELLRLFTGELLGWGGAVLLLGEVPMPGSFPPRSIRRQIATLDGSPGLIGRLSIERNVLAGRAGHMRLWAALAGRFSMRDRHAAHLAMEQAGLIENARQLAGTAPELAPRIALARCLCQEPRILVMEPGWEGGHDLLEQEKFLRLVSSISRTRQLTLIFAGSTPGLAARYADRLLGMRNGCLVYDGAVDGLSGRDYGRFFPDARGPAHLRLVV